MKRIILVFLSLLLLGIPLFSETSGPVHETGYNAPAILRNLIVPDTGLIVTITTPGIVYLSPTATKIYVRLDAVTPNALVHSVAIPAALIASTDQYFKVGDKLALISSSGTATVNMTTQSWGVLPK